MLKRIIKKFIRFFGIDIVRYRPGAHGKSVRTDRLSFYKTATGNYYLPSDAKRDVVANTIIANQIFEEEVVLTAKKYIKEGTAVLDVGANFGQMSVLFSGMTGPQGKVYSFDADDFIFEILKKNIAANNKEQVIEPVFGAVSNKAGETLYFPVQDFERFQAYGSYGIDPNAKAGRAVKTITIDNLSIQKPISFMKIDIQGFDLQAMQGAVETIKKHRMPILFEYEYHFEEEYKLSFQEYVDFVRDINYKFEKVLNGHNFLIVPRN
jgi:FkbM family methyltransferase